MSQISENSNHDADFIFKKEPKFYSHQEADPVVSPTIKKSKKRKIKAENTDAEKVCKKSEKKVKKKVKKAKKEPEDVWKWWEETPHPNGVNWVSLVHKGPIFAPLYTPLPNFVKLIYNGQPVELSEHSEEIASLYAQMLESHYAQNEIFNKNFFNDWRNQMTSSEKKVIIDFSKCDFTKMHHYYQQQREARLKLPSEEKRRLKAESEASAQQYGICYIDGHAQRIENVRVEPPGLFRGRGDHPKQGRLKKRVQPEDVIINISEDAPVPDPPSGHQWKAVVHDSSVTWLASWYHNVIAHERYVWLLPGAKARGIKDMGKYDIARGLHMCIQTIRKNYMEGMSSNDMGIRQRSVALYFIDRLALRAGHEKEEGETADTVGCCSLRVEHIVLRRDTEGTFVDFDFLGKDSIRYVNSVKIEKKVFKNLRLFTKKKRSNEDLFDRLSTTSLNKYLRSLMPGLSAKVFRTYNASTTLQSQLLSLTRPKDEVYDKVLAYNRANRAVALLCNHQRAISKTFDQSRLNLLDRLKKKKEEVKKCKTQYRELKKLGGAENVLEKKKKQFMRLKEQLHRQKINLTDKDENKQIALGTSKINYLDPRITVAWCKKYDVPIEKIFNKSIQNRFQWAIEMADSEFIF